MRRPDPKLLTALLAAGLGLVALALQWRSTDAPPVAREAPQQTADVVEPRRPPAARLPKAAVDAEPELRSVWAVSDPDTPDAPPKVREDLPATLIRIDRDAITSATEGDTLTLPISATGTAEMEIETVKLNSRFGVTSLRGSTVVNGTALPAVITYSDQSTLATINTPRGVYELRGTAEMGWLYRAEDLGVPGGDVVDYVTREQETAPR